MADRSPTPVQVLYQTVQEFYQSLARIGKLKPALFTVFYHPEVSDLDITFLR